MDVSSHFLFSILTVSQFAENRKAGKSTLLTLMVTAQRGGLLESRARLHFTLTYSRPKSVSASLSPCIVFPLNIFEYGCECDAQSHFSRNLRGISVVTHHPNLFKPLRPVRWSVPEQDADSLPAYRAADPDLCLLQTRATEKKDNPLPLPPHASIPPTGSAFDWTVPLNLKAATCLDRPAARCFLPSLCTCCWRWGEQVWHLLASPASPFIKPQ